LASTSGAAYAISANTNNDENHKVRVNPLYQTQGKNAEVHLS